MIALAPKGKAMAWSAAFGISVGLTAGWGLWHPRPPVVEAPAASVHQPDSSLVLARRPDTVLRIVHRIPPGYVPERSVEIAVQPKPKVDTLWRPGAVREILRVDTLKPPVVRVALTVARLGDGSHRVIASSPDGRILDSLSIDVPVGPSAAPARALPYSAGVTRDLLSGAWGAIASRDAGPFRIFAGAEAGAIGRPAQLKIGIGLRF